MDNNALLQILRALLTPQDQTPAPDTPHADLVGEFVIVRCRDAGVHAGTLLWAQGRACGLTGARRLWAWKARSEHTLSGVARHGIVHAESKVAGPVRIDLTGTCEIIPCSDESRESIDGAPIHGS